jgi:4-amino-4-deoxy-L-arabinose transferase-like glycosyltransferase
MKSTGVWFERIGFQRFLLALLILIGFGIRIFDLTDPPLDFHPTRQLRSAILSRAYFYQWNPSADPVLRDKAQLMAQSLEVYEPPILEGIVAGVYLAAGQEIWWVARILNAIFWGIGGMTLYWISRRYTGFYASLTGLAFYLCLPFSIIASRSFQPDPWMVMWLLLAVAGLLRWMDKQSWQNTILAGLLAGMTVLVKLVTVFPLALIWGSVVLSQTDWRKWLKSPQFYVGVVLAALPSIIFYLINLGQRSAGFFSFWTVALSHLILETSFYADWMSMLHNLFGLSNILLSVLGIVLAKREYKAILAGGWAGYFIYGLFFPYQMITHEYYHLMVIALIGLSLPPLVEAVYQQIRTQHWVWRLAAVGGLVFSAGYCLYVGRSVLIARSYTNEPIAWQKIGEAIPADGKLIALTSEYGNRLMYYGWRGIAGYWPDSGDLKLFSLAGSGPMQFESYFAEKTTGMDYFLITMFSEFDAQPDLKNKLTSGYPVLSEGDGYLLFDLRHPKKP